MEKTTKVGREALRPPPLGLDTQGWHTLDGLLAISSLLMLRHTFGCLQGQEHSVRVISWLPMGPRLSQYTSQGTLGQGH
jgi:hypothetical protein